MNPFIRLVFIACLCIAAAAFPAASAAAGADSLRVDSPRENALHPGMWALMFQIDEDIVPKPFEGLGIALKRHLSRRAAIRLGFDLDLSVNEDDAESWRSLDDTLRIFRDDNNERSGQSAVVELLYVRYPWPDSYINFFWGFGPVASFSRSRQDREGDSIVYDTETMHYRQSYYSRSWSVGFKGIAGVEWFATRRISLHMEYQATVSYLSKYSEIEETDSYRSSEEYRETSGADWSLGAGRVVVGISMYF